MTKRDEFDRLWADILARQYLRPDMTPAERLSAVAELHNRYPLEFTREDALRWLELETKP